MIVKNIVAETPINGFNDLYTPPEGQSSIITSIIQPKLGGPEGGQFYIVRDSVRYVFYNFPLPGNNTANVLNSPIFLSDGDVFGVDVDPENISRFMLNIIENTDTNAITELIDLTTTSFTLYTNTSLSPEILVYIYPYTTVSTTDFNLTINGNTETSFIFDRIPWSDNIPPQDRWKLPIPIILNPGDVLGGSRTDFCGGWLGLRSGDYALGIVRNIS